MPKATTLHGEAKEPILGQPTWPDDECRGDEDAYAAAFNSGQARKRSILARIMARCTPVQRVDGMTPCLEWTGPTSGGGRGGLYGRFSFEGVTCSTHRTVFAIVFGPIPPRKQIDHKCNNRICCNPDHLQHTTHKKNQKLRDERRQNDNL